MNNLKRSLTFIVLTFVLSYSLAFAFFGLGGRANSAQALIMAVVYMFIPTVSAVLLQKFVYGEGLKDIGLRWKINRWYLAAWLLPIGISIATFGVNLLFPGITYAPDMAGMFDRFKDLLTPQQMAEMEQQAKALPVHPFWITLIQSLVAGFTVNAVAAFGEELGWRGYLQKYLGELGFWKSSLVIGFVWGLWHAPLILQGHNYPQHPQLGVLMMTLWTILLSPVFSYVRLRGGSVLAAAVIHGSINAAYGLAVMLIQGGNDLSTGVTGLPGFIVLAGVNLAILLYERYWAREKIDDVLRGEIL